MTAAIEFRGVSRVFGDVRAVDDVSFAIEPGEFFAMLGPSGSGKTSCLRLVAGFDSPDRGQVLLDGEDVSSVPPYERNVNTVFQDYALFPHMSVLENVAYGPRVRGVDAATRRQRAHEMLDLVQLGAQGERHPAQLSGGQRQRVALARALINQPAVLLLDEPLGALDLKLRQEMQIELKAIQQRVRLTFIYVTHDQEEALTMSDRLAVFNAGRIEQVGTPADVYEHPASTFVAGFVGTSNLLTGETARAVIGREGIFTVRPEKIRIGDPSETPADDEASALGTIRDVVYIGPDTRYIVALETGSELVVTQQNLRTSSTEALDARGRSVRLVWKRNHALILAKSEEGVGESEEGNHP